MIYTETFSKNKDSLTNMDIKAASLATMAVVDSIQKMKTHEQIAGLCISFILLCENYGVPAQDVFTYSKNIINGADGKRVEFKGVQHYMKNKLK